MRPGTRTGRGRAPDPEEPVVSSELRSTSRTFVDRHVGPDADAIERMLAVLGLD